MDESLTKYFLNKKKGIINISQGPRFKTKGGTILAMLFLGFLVVSIVSLIQIEILTSFICFVISYILISLVLDIHGIELNRDLQKIRDYKMILWFKIGAWYDLNKFKTIYVMQKNVIVGRSSGNTNTRSDTIHYYQIKLVDEVDKKEIFLAEYTNYYRAHKIAKNITEATGLELKDFLKGSKK